MKNIIALLQNSKGNLKNAIKLTLLAIFAEEIIDFEYCPKDRDHEVFMDLVNKEGASLSDEDLIILSILSVDEEGAKEEFARLLSKANLLSKTAYNELLTLYKEGAYCNFGVKNKEEEDGKTEFFPEAQALSISDEEIVKKFWEEIQIHPNIIKEWCERYLRQEEDKKLVEQYLFQNIA